MPNHLKDGIINTAQKESALHGLQVVSFVLYFGQGQGKREQFSGVYMGFYHRVDFRHDMEQLPSWSAETAQSEEFGSTYNPIKTEELLPESSEEDVEVDQPRYMSLLHAKDPLIVQEAADALLSQWNRQKGKAAEEHLAWAENAIEEFDLELAETVLLQLIDTYADWAEPYHRLGELYFMCERMEESVQFSRLAIAKNPAYFPAWHALALTAALTKDWHLAEQATDRALEIYPSFASVAEINCTAKLHLA